jgi:class 3 adenylate cyclase
MPDLPPGTVTFLFTDIEGTTRLLQRLDGHYADLLLDRRRLLRTAFQQWGGHKLGTEAEALIVALSRAADALQAVVAAQLALATRSWPESLSVRVRTRPTHR